MNFAAQFFANFATDGSQPQETRRGFNDSEEYDPFWQRWETVRNSEPRRVCPTANASQCPAESERCEDEPDESRNHVATPVPSSGDSQSPSRKASEAPGSSPVDPAETLPLFPHLGENPTFLSLFQALVYIFLRLFLSFILLFLPRAEQRLGSRPAGGPCAKDARLANGPAGRRSTLICPERLKDFGAEEYLNGDVKVFETSVSEPAEVQLRSPPKASAKKSAESKPAPQAALEHLRFEDISAAAVRLQQSGVQRTPCTYSRLSKQYGMEIYLKKELLHYTGSVRERGVLCLLSSLTQDQQRKGVIVATDCNFSMAVAHHAAEMRIPVFVIMPAHSSPPRLRMYRDYGAMVISYGSTARDSSNHARHLAKENGYLCLEE